MTWTLECEHPFSAALTVRRYRHDNGLRAILLEDHAAPIISYQTWFRVGSRHEHPGETGMAHLFEHLMFNATRSLAPGEFDRLIESAGGESNAATWVDWTFYRDNLPARDLELAVRLEADRMANLVLEDEQLEAEREVVANERMLRVEDDVDGFLDEKLHELAFTRHPYRWPTIGWMEDIRALSKPAVHAFYRTFYAPNNATLVLVGDFDGARALELLGRYYGGLAPAAIPVEASESEPMQEEERRAVFAKPVPADRVVMGFKAPAQGDPDWVVMEFISDILAGAPSSRLYKRMVIEREIATSVDCALTPFRDPSLLRIAANVARGHSARAVEAEVADALAALREQPVPERELTRVKNGAETDLWAALASSEGKAEALGHYETTLGDFRRLFETARRLGEVTAADIQRVARTYLLPARSTVVIAQPGGDGAEGDDDDDDDLDTDVSATPLLGGGGDPAAVGGGVAE